jgi:hypothetical protein
MSTNTMTRRVSLVAATALLAGVGLVAPSSVATAAPAVAITRVAGPTTIRVPATSTRYAYSMSFTGPAPSYPNTYYTPYSTSYSGPSVSVVSSRDSAAYKPYISTSQSSSTMTPSRPVVYSMTLNQYTTPGRYKVTIPIAYRASTDVNASRAFIVNVIANSAITESLDYFNMYGTFSKRSRWQVQYSGPTYVRGAKLSIYYKAKGKKKYTKIGSKTLNSVGDASFKLKKGKVRKTGKLYYKLSAVAWAPAMKSHTYSIVKR